MKILLIITISLSAYYSFSQPAIDWVHSLGSTSNNFSNDIHIDINGDIIVTGGFSGTVDFNPGAGTNELTSTNSWSDAFVFKMNEAQNLLWVKSFQGSMQVSGYSVATDNSGAVYV